MEALEQLCRERGMELETMLDAVANGLVSAYKRSPGAAEEARVTIDADTGEVVVYGQELDEDGNVTREWEDTPSDFGRIAAQTFKQVFQQRTREAKREQVYEIYHGRENELVTGMIQQVDHRYSMVDLGDAEAIMPSSERIPYERLERGTRVKALILEVREEGKGAPIVVSRSHPDFIRKLFELEVPEIAEGIVEIRGLAREAGHRTKVAVHSNDRQVDAVGACVGARGSRVRQVVNELRGEKIDLCEWQEDPKKYITEALSPVKGVRDVIIDEEEKKAIVIVPDNQLSLAIGKDGQNARLSARMTGYGIEIRPESNPEGTRIEETTPAAADAPTTEEASVAGDAAEATVTADATDVAAADAPTADAPAEAVPAESPVADASEDDAPASEVEVADAATATDDAPASPDVSEPAEPEVPPQIPDSDVPEVPDSDIPEMPEVPDGDVPEVPDSDVPELPDVPDSDVPEVPGVPDSDVPELPPVPDMPADDGVAEPAFPDMPEAPKPPEPQQMAEVSEVAGAPDGADTDADVGIAAGETDV
ncbi:MAG: transcription termination/antitermination protein NusA [Acidimicrobiia bacterium]|nr:transcription termination/antitermination protein NusA [Acidimicrobiia bacterium]